MKKESSRILAHMALVAILGFVLYVNSFHGKFVWDDSGLIENNAYIKNWSYIPKILTNHIGSESETNAIHYRPLQIFTYLIDYSIWKYNVTGYHLTNALLHIAVALSIYWFVTILFGNRFLSLLTCMFFVTHPVQTEAVTYISGRADPLAALFMVLCFIFYIKNLGSKNTITYIFILISYTFALLSRENSLILPVLILLYHYTFKKKFEIRSFLFLVITSITYIIFRTTALKISLPETHPSSDVLERIPGFFAAITSYIRLILLPFNLHMEYGNKLFNYSNPKTISGIVILVSLVIYAFRKRGSSQIIFFSISWFILTLLPVSNIYPLNAYMAEHWLYLPSVGFFIIMANCVCCICTVEKYRYLSISAAICLLCCYSFLTIRQNNYWKEPIAFYKRILQYAPDSSRIYNNLGIAYEDKGDKETAIGLFEKAIELNPYYSESYYNLGFTYDEIGEKEKSIALYKKATELTPNYAKAYNNLGNIYKDLARTEEAIESYKKAIESNPNFARAYLDLGLIYSAVGRTVESIASYNKAIEIDPNLADAYISMGVSYYCLGKLETAINFYEKALGLEPHNTTAYNNLGLVYQALGQYEESINVFKKLIEIDPDYSRAYNNLAVAYYFNKQYGLAILHCDKAVSLGHKVNPDFLAALRPYRGQKSE